VGAESLVIPLRRTFSDQYERIKAAERFAEL